MRPSARARTRARPGQRDSRARPGQRDSRARPGQRDSRSRPRQRDARPSGLQAPTVGQHGGGRPAGRHPPDGGPQRVRARTAPSRRLRPTTRRGTAIHPTTRRGTAKGGRHVSLREGRRGSITAETAVALPALVVVLAVALWGVSAAAAQIACLDAARAGARAAARGEPQAEVRSAVLRAAPPNARVTVSRDETTTKVIVQAQTDSPLRGLFPALKLKAQAIAATEPQPNDTTFPTGNGAPPAPTGSEGAPPAPTGPEEEDEKTQ
ncbi:TadE family type IV pilus minor pilin [Actinoallomurus sp. NBC_01490]|uniref:TadE family type IV pilus minor pilin n=1 Tax=Actinoallomurus sp. NBC_01490 TaxID=2903557 RepID=UPI002E36D52D|nr:TadE family type IV pilus minor pilin [Actinoallomurus sp. NBC_01490]